MSGARSSTLCTPVTPGCPASQRLRSYACPMRAGDSGDVTNVVIELSSKVKYTASLSKDGKQLVISLPDAAWKAGASGMLNGHSDLAASYQYAHGEVSVALAAPAAIRAKQTLEADKTAGYRIVISLVKAK